MPQPKHPEAVGQEEQQGCHQRGEPGQPAQVAPEDETGRVEGGQSVGDDPGQQDVDGFRVDRQRVLGEEMVIEHQPRHRHRVHDPEGGHTGQQVEGDEDESAAEHVGDEHQQVDRRPDDVQGNGRLDQQRHAHQEVAHPVLAEAVGQQVEERIDRADQEPVEAAGADVDPPQGPQVVRKHVVDGFRQGDEPIHEQDLVVVPAVQHRDLLHDHPDGQDGRGLQEDRGRCADDKVGAVFHQRFDALGEEVPVEGDVSGHKIGFRSADFSPLLAGLCAD